MLAMKFHHLRTLTHRPYLCLAWLQRHDRPLMALLEREHNRVEALERICVLEAQQTAHLLHNVPDERSLVHDFPWWQMISCLLCASSVLLVSRACIEPSQPGAGIQSQALDEDAETCLKVFDALSANSDAARRARDMMKGLKRTRILPRSKSQRQPFRGRHFLMTLLDPLLARPDSSSMNRYAGGVRTEVSALENLADATLDETFNYGVRHNVLEWPSWPGELSDSMAWSAQFIDPSQYSDLHGGPR